MTDTHFYKSWDYLRNEMELDCPNLRALAYPKDLKVPDGYASPEVFEMSAYASCHYMLTGGTEDMDPTMFAVYAATLALTRYQVPTYFVSRELCEALLRTRPPEDLRFNELYYPMQSMLFMLPKEFAVEYFGIPVLYITTSVIDGQGAFLRSPYRFKDRKPREIENLSKDSLWLTTAFSLEDVPSHYHGRAPMSGQVKQLMNWQHHIINKNDGSEATDEEVKQTGNFVSKLTSLSCNILLGITAEKELITREHILVPAKKDGGEVVRRALWRPNFVGERFRIKYEHISPAGHHRSPHAHWRIGHWRNQRKGPGLTITERIWIQPVFVGIKLPNGSKG